MELKYRNGRMRIHLDRFLPCTLADFRKLLKVIDISDNRDANIKTMKTCLEQKIIVCESVGTKAAKADIIKFTKCLSILDKKLLGG